jgi:hypothetical protein
VVLVIELGGVLHIEGDFVDDFNEAWLGFKMFRLMPLAKERDHARARLRLHEWRLR